VGTIMNGRRSDPARGGPATSGPGTSGSTPGVRPPMPVVPGRIGVLGGTFDPIHVGHLALAEEAREALGLEQVRFIPAGAPWQKADRDVSPVEHRLAMVELAIAGAPRFAASRLEIDRPGPTHTADTLEALGRAERDAGREPDLWFLLSTEAIRGLATWHEPDRVLRLARLAVAPRPTPGGPRGLTNDARAAFEEVGLPGLELGDRVVMLDGPWLDVSSSAIRDRVRAGRSIRYLVPDAVAAYIGDHGLYTTSTRRSVGS
jgi:nicotinate-nucleotide adenylyltransferase